MLMFLLQDFKRIFIERLLLFHYFVANAVISLIQLFQAIPPLRGALGLLLIPGQSESTEEKNVISTKTREISGGISFMIQAELMCSAGSGKDHGPSASVLQGARELSSCVNINLQLDPILKCL